MSPSDTWIPLLLLILVGVPAAIGWLGVAGPILKARRMQRVDAESQAPGQGHESASGPVRKSLSGEDGPEDPAEALRWLEEARLLLFAAESLLNDAASRSIWDILGLSMDRGRSKQSSFGAGVRKLREAEDLAHRASGEWGLREGREPLELDTDAALLNMDTAWATDSPLIGLRVHRNIEQAQRRTRALRARIEDLLSEKRAKIRSTRPTL